MSDELTPEQQQVEQEALDTYNNSQQEIKEQVTGQTDEIPEGYNSDGTPITEDKILGKFESQDDLVKAYQELEQKLSQPEAVKEETPKEVVETEATPAEFSKFHQEFQTNGELGDDSYKELEKLGFNKNDVDAYIEGQKALASNFTSKVYELTGGEENYTQLVTWASENMDSSTVGEYNEALQSGDSAKVLRLVEYMNFKRGSGEQRPTRLEGNAPAETGGLKAFANKAEWQQATANPLYGKDPKYTNMIDKRYLSAINKGNI